MAYNLVWVIPMCITICYAKSLDDNQVSEGKMPVFKSKRMLTLTIKQTGNMVAFKCRAVGNPEPNITWYKDNEIFTNRVLGDMMIYPSSLIIEDLITEDEGNYTCVVCNIHGCINHTTTLKVVERDHNRPLIQRSIENATVPIHTEYNLTCTFVSGIIPYIQWVKMDANRTETKVVQSGGPTPEVYTIKNVTHEDEGWYSCAAVNTLGITKSEAYLTVVDSLPENQPKEPQIVVREIPQKVLIILFLVIIILVFVVISFLLWKIRFNKRNVRKKTDAALENIALSTNER